MPIAVDRPEPGPVPETDRSAGDADDAPHEHLFDHRSVAARSPGRWLVFLVGAAVVAAMSVVVVAVVHPTWSAEVPMGNELVRETTVDALVLAVISAAFGWWVWRRISRPLGAAVTGTALLALAAVLVPLVALQRTATAADMSLSYVDDARHRGNSAVPDDSRSVPYAQVGGRSLLLDVWPATAPANGGAIVWVHDGGWVSGIRSSTPRLDEWFTRHGYTVFDIDYRLAPQARNGDAAADVRCAVSWVQGRAEQYGIDADRVILAGASSGGQLALTAAYDPAGPSSCAPGASGDSSVLAVMALYPATDVVSLYAADTNDGTMRDWLRKSFGGDPTQQVEAYRDGSPTAHVRAGLPPTLLVHGGQDDAIPASQTEELAAALDGAGVERRSVILPFTDHAFDHSWNALGTQIARQLLVDFADDQLSR